MAQMERFVFHPLLENQRFVGYEKSSTQEYLMKWSLQNGMKLQAFAFDRPYKSYLYQEFVKDFLSDSTVTSNLQCQSQYRCFAPIGYPAESIKMKEVKSTLTSISLFDRLSENDVVVRSSGAIRKCMEEYYDPTLESGDFEYGIGIGDQIEVSDELRKMLLNPDSDYADLFSEEEKDEFLFRIFKHLVIGGTLCQYEDNLNPYLDITKILYKDLVRVTPEDGGELMVTSSVIQILEAKCDSYDPSRSLIFHRPHVNNFFYLIVDPYKRVVYTLYHQA